MRRVPASHGWFWLVESFGLFRRSPLNWIVIVMILFLAVEVVIRVPLLGALLLLFYPGVVAGLMIGCDDLEHGRSLTLGHLLAGVRANPVHLTTLGGIYLIGQLVIMWIMTLVGGEQMQLLASGKLDQTDPQALAAAYGAVLRGLLAGSALSIPLLMALWFSPLLAAFDRIAPLPALWLSLRACWINMGAFLVYGLLVLAGVTLAMLPFGLSKPELNPGMWILAPLLLPSIYASYRDVFVKPEQAPRAAG